VRELSIRNIGLKNELKKIRNAEMGNPRKEKYDYCNFFGFF
jgi:hypothetical protein